MTAASFAQALDQITRVPGVRGAMLVAGDDGLVVAITAPDVNAGLVRLELLRAAEAVG